MNYRAAADFVLAKLTEGLAENLYYHHVQHVLDVIQATEKICQLEGLDGQDTTLLKTAALFHDTGFLVQYEKNEPYGAAFARQWLPEFNYSTKEIEEITTIILATDISKEPQGHWQKIIRDADLDYLGRSDFFSISQSLRQELVGYGQIIKLSDWYCHERDFLEQHIYYTDSAFALRHAGKMANLEEIASLLKDAPSADNFANNEKRNRANISKDRKSILDALSRTTLFSMADQQLLEQTARICNRIQLKSGEPVFRKGDKGESMYIIDTGTLRIHDDHITLAQLGQGEYFGEASLIDNSTRTASVSAETDAVVLRIAENDFFSLLGTHPSMNRLLMKELIHRLRNQNDAVVEEYKNREQKLQELVVLRTRQIIEEKKNVEGKSVELEKAMLNLQAAQKLLIHQEKMASLGQLTTGIAHELMNPLNFVNNFSGISAEIIDEIIEEDISEDARSLCSELRENISRISLHGQRASDIVRSMAEHSASFSKERQDVDIHSLLDEAINVSKKAWMSAEQLTPIRVELQLEADNKVLKAVYSDLFRVIVNLLRNAATAIRKKNENGAVNGCIHIRTHNQGNDIELLIKDNGHGVASDIQEKIFLPFFSTQPTGQGVGLGLSISQQIIAAYNGKLALQSADENGACFAVSLPVIQD